MNERPGEHEPAYPPAPAPRTEPYSVDEPDRRPYGTADTDRNDEYRTRGEHTPRDDRAPAYEPAAGYDPWRPAHGSPAGQGDGPATSHAQVPWSSPRGETDTRAYPASAPPPEYVPGDGRAAAPADHLWRDPSARPWRPPTGETHPQQVLPQQARRRRRRRQVGLGVVVLLVLVALLGGLVLGALGARALWPAASSSGTLPTAGSPVSTTRPPDSVAGIAAAALESTVFIEVVGGSSASSGSGMVLREDGYLVTNNHVIAAAADGRGVVLVTFPDGGQEEAEIVGRTTDYDLAVLRVRRDGLTPLPLADSDAVVVGDPVVAVGAPLGLEGTVTSGIVSALNRPVQAGNSQDTSFINAIQTDAAINPGNSGGPLINAAGEVVGINTAIAQASGQPTGSIGLGFSIPSNQVRRTAEEIIETGRATYPVIGVALDTRYQGEGVQVLETDSDDTPAVTPGGPGEEAGIEPGDVITHIDGQPVTTPSELIVAVRARAPGDTVVLTVRSDDGEREVEVVLDEAVSDG